MDPEDARNILVPLVTEMCKAVYAYNGTLIHTAGDGIVVAFGVPTAIEDHALRACLAALAIQEKVHAMHNALKVRIGLNSGEIIFDTVGDATHLEYDISGALSIWQHAWNKQQPLAPFA